MALGWDPDDTASGGAIAFHTGLPFVNSYTTNTSSVPSERVFKINATTPNSTSKEISFSGNQARMGAAISVFGEVWSSTKK